MPVFQNPEYLWLLLLAPVFLFTFRRQHSRARGIVIATVRILIFALLVLALAEPTLRRENDAVTTYFVLDQSGSIPEDMKSWSLDVAQRSARGKRRHDRAGLIVFGSQAVIEESPTPHFSVEQVFSVVDDSNTDLSAALRLALSTFPEDTQKRIVLFTDGNETRGDLSAALLRATAAHCPIDVVPLRYHYRNEVAMESLTLPARVQRHEPFQLRTCVRALGESRGVLQVFCDGELIAAQDVDLHDGENVFLFSHTLQTPGFHLLEAQVSAENDGLHQNNRAQAYTIIQEEALILLAANAEPDVSQLARALREEGIACRVRLAGALPQDLGEWQSYDALVLANLGADALSQAQLEMIESLVKDLGAGFLMIGGEKSFGAGGYLGTPIERVLPVSLDVTQREVLPNGGIAFILDHVHCIGDRWSKDIVVGTLNGLTQFDWFGLRAGQRHDWIIPLQPATNREELTNQINALRAGDVSDLDAQLDRVIEAFNESRCAYRHAVLITDGRGRIVPSGEAIGRLREANVTLSIVVIEPRGINLEALRRAAQRAGGNFYVVHPHQYHLVPRIYIRESALVKKGLYFEETFQPVLKELSEILEGITAAELPVLHGYNVTSRKDPTEIPLVSPSGDAVLAHWQYGLGKSVAFTSDASTRWAADWITWDKYRRFWSQAVRWCQRRLAASPYYLTLQKGSKDGTCEAILDAQDEQGNFVNFLSPVGTLVTPQLDSRTLRFEQTGPGRYLTLFPVDRSGGYIVNVRYTQDGRLYLLRGGYVPPCDLEYTRFQSNEPLLHAIAEQTGGSFVAPETNLFAPTGMTAYTSKPIRPLLLLLAVCLFPFDVFSRRVMIGPRDVAAIARALIPGLRRGASTRPSVLERARDAVRTRSAWTPGQPELEDVVAEAAPREATGEVPDAEAAPEEVETVSRLMKAKQKAKKKFYKS